MTILVLGLPLPCKTIVRWLKENGLNVKVSNIFEALSSKDPDIVHFVYSPTGKFRGPIIFSLMKLTRKKIIIHWVGSDVFQLFKSKKWVLLTKLTSKLVDKQLTVSPWLKEELSCFGVHTQIVPIVPHVRQKVSKLPEEFTVLAYLPEKRYDFYGGHIVEKLSDMFPSIRFFILANDGRNHKKRKNIKYLGSISHVKMSQIYKKTTVLIRMPIHDGLSNMVIEALAQGRYVIYSKNFPHCFHAKNFEDAKDHITNLYEVNEPNYAGAEFSLAFINRSIKKLLALYSEMSCM